MEDLETQEFIEKYGEYIHPEDWGLVSCVYCDELVLKEKSILDKYKQDFCSNKCLKSYQEDYA